MNSLLTLAKDLEQKSKAIRQRLLYEAKASKFTMVCRSRWSAVHDGLPR
ncbi:MbeB family mobilization protein [Salmonella enterica]